MSAMHRRGVGAGAIAKKKLAEVKGPVWGDWRRGRGAGPK